MILISSLCDKSTVVQILLLVKTLFKIICFLTPFIIIIVTSITLFKAIASGKTEDLKDNWVVFVKRIIAGLIIFFIPAIISFCINNFSNSKELNFITCFNVASKERLEQLKEQELAKEEQERILQEAEDERLLKENYAKDQRTREENKRVFEEYKNSKDNTLVSNLNYNNSIEIPNSVFKNARNSNLSVVIVDDIGNVVAHKNPQELREGGSTAKVFTGYAAVKLLDPTKDTIINTQYAQNMPYMGSPDVKVGQTLSVPAAATKDFPGSSNITTANIAIAIGKKYHNSTTDRQAYIDGMNEINNFLKETGCSKTKLISSSGVNYNYETNKFSGNKNGISTGEFGMTANDLGLITIKAMKDENFSNGINYGKNGLCNPPNNNTFFIKSGTQAYKHGVWGFNQNGKRYYAVVLGVNFNKGDDRCKTFNDVYEWAMSNAIK